MKNVNKTIALLLSVVMLLSLAAGCSGSAPESSAPTSQSPAPEGQTSQSGAFRGGGGATRGQEIGRAHV